MNISLYSCDDYHDIDNVTVSAYMTELVKKRRNMKQTRHLCTYFDVIIPVVDDGDDVDVRCN